MKANRTGEPVQEHGGVRAMSDSIQELIDKKADEREQETMVIMADRCDQPLLFLT